MGRTFILIFIFSFNSSCKQQSTNHSQTTNLSLNSISTVYSCQFNNFCVQFDNISQTPEDLLNELPNYCNDPKEKNGEIGIWSENSGCNYDMPYSICNGVINTNKGSLKVSFYRTLISEELSLEEMKKSEMETCFPEIPNYEGKVIFKIKNE